MGRPLWRGTLSFGLVLVPVRMYRAVSPKDIHFHLIHEKDGGRVQQKRVCSVDGEEIPSKEIVKGFEIGKNQHVLFKPEELEALSAQASKAIEIEDFVKLSEIDPVFFSSTDYLVPEAGAEKAYGLLHRAMREAEKVGIARMVIRSRQNLCAVRPLGDGLVLSTMYSADEIVPRDQVDDVEAPAQAPIRASSPWRTS